MMMHPKESGQDDTVTTVDCIVFGRCDKQADAAIYPVAESLEDMTNWANTPLDHPTAMSSAEDLTGTENDILISRSNPTANRDKDTTTSTTVAEAAFFPVWRSGGTVACVDDISPKHFLPCVEIGIGVYKIQEMKRILDLTWEWGYQVLLAVSYLTTQVTTLILILLEVPS